MSFQQDQNEYEEFQEKFGDYITYDLNREQVLDGFYAAYQKEKTLEELVLVENPAELEEDFYEYFSEDSGWTESIRDLLKPLLSEDEVEEKEYAEFMDDFEVESTEEEML